MEEGRGQGAAFLTRVLDGHVRDQEVLPEGGVLAEAAFVGLVVHVRQLVVQQHFFVLTDVVTELTLEPARTAPSVPRAAGPSCPPPEGEPGALALPGPAAAGARLLPAVRNGLDVCQQVHLEGVALLKGLPALRWKRAKQRPPPAQPHSLPAPPRPPLSPCHTCAASPCCASSCAA